MSGTPRVLTIGFKIHVNRELRANIRFARIEQAAEALINGVLTLVPRVFPWAERIEVTRGWSYDWWDPETEMEPVAFSARRCGDPGLDGCRAVDGQVAKQFLWADRDQPFLLLGCGAGASVLAMTAPADFGISPEVLADIEAAHRALQPILDSMQPVIGIIERQQGVMEAMRRSFEIAMQAQPPPRTRQEFTDLVHLLRGQARRAATAHPETVTVSAEAEQAAIALLPQTPEEAEEVERDIAEIKADPELSGELQRLVRDDWAGLRRWTTWAVLVWVAGQLSELANSPVTEHLSTAQIAVVQDRLMVLAVVATLVQIIFMTSDRD